MPPRRLVIVPSPDFLSLECIDLSECERWYTANLDLCREFDIRPDGEPGPGVPPPLYRTRKKKKWFRRKWDDPWPSGLSGLSCNTGKFVGMSDAEARAWLAENGSPPPDADRGDIPPDAVLTPPDPADPLD